MPRKAVKAKGERKIVKKEDYAPGETKVTFDDGTVEIVETADLK